MDYATIDDLRQYAYHAGVNDQVRWEDIIPRASRIIDTVCEVAPGHFAAALEQPAERCFTGSGTRWLQVDPFIKGSIQFVEYEFSDEFTPDYIERHDALGNHYLIAATGECWADDEPLVIIARWGWPDVPDDIREAAIEVALQIWRQRDSAYARVVTDVNGAQQIFGALPDRVKEICLRRRRFNAPVCV